MFGQSIPNRGQGGNGEKGIIEAIGPAVRLGGTEQGGPVVMPAIKAKDFNFTSLSDAV